MSLMENYVDKMIVDLKKYKKGGDIHQEGEEIIYKCKKLLKSFKTAEFFFIDKTVNENEIEE